MYFGLARRNLSRHRVRSLLAVVGIIIGVVAIASLGIFGNSIRLSVADAFGDVGNELLIFPAFENGKVNITDETFRQITKVRGINRAVPIKSGADAVILNKDASYASIYGINGEDMPYILEINDGHFLKKNSDNCVVGATLANDKDLIVGSKVSIKGKGFRVVGILKEKGIGIGMNPDQSIFISSDMYSEIYDSADYDTVIVKVKNLEEVDRVKEDIEKTLNKREDFVMVMAMEALLEGINSFFNTLSTFLMGIGSISLIVAGVSILNVMLMSTTERTKEIGVMRAIGASKGEVLRMFILEALIISAVGSVIGGVLSFAGGFVINILILKQASYLFDPSSFLYVFLGMGFGLLTGLLGGMYPAWRASQLKPIDALRFE